MEGAGFKILESQAKFCRAAWGFFGAKKRRLRMTRDRGNRGNLNQAVLSENQTVLSKKQGTRMATGTLQSVQVEKLISTACRPARAAGPRRSWMSEVARWSNRQCIRAVRTSYRA